MGAGKWIGGIIGFMAGGPLGALAGYALGSLIELGGNTASYTTDYGNGQTEEDVFAGQRNSFLFSMLVMASYIIRADGRIMHSEMEYVRNFLRTNFGVAAVGEGERILLNLFEQRKRMDMQNPLAFRQTIRDCGRQIKKWNPCSTWAATPWKLPTKFWKFFLQPPMRRCVPPIANWY